MNDGDGDLDRLDGLIAQAKRAGADAADAMLARSTALQASWRMGRNEGVERAEDAELGLRVFVGARQAVVSTTDLGAAARDPLVERALAMARAVPEDPHCGLPDAAGARSEERRAGKGCRSRSSPYHQKIHLHTLIPLQTTN